MRDFPMLYLQPVKSITFTISINAEVFIVTEPFLEVHLL